MAYSVLIVDDEALTLRTLGRALGDEGYEVFLAMSGEEALKILCDDHPDFALLFVVLAGINGIEVLRQAITLNHSSNDERIPHGGSWGRGHEAWRIRVPHQAVSRC
jgi:DNA-binding response OmpR family regulator